MGRMDNYFFQEKELSMENGCFFRKVRVKDCYIKKNYYICNS